MSNFSSVELTKGLFTPHEAQLAQRFLNAGPRLSKFFPTQVSQALDVLRLDQNRDEPS